MSRTRTISGPRLRCCPPRRPTARRWIVAAVQGVPVGPVPAASADSRTFGTIAAEPRSSGEPSRCNPPKHDDAWLDIVGEEIARPVCSEPCRWKDARRAPAGEPRGDPLPRAREPVRRQCKIQGSCVGYLSREDAILYRPPVRAAASVGRLIACHARFIGGWDRGHGDVASIGVQLHIGSPRECMVEIDGDTDERRRGRTDHPPAKYLIAFTGDSSYSLDGMPLDRATSEELARRAGLSVHPRVSKQVQLLVIATQPGCLSGKR